MKTRVLLLTAFLAIVAGCKGNGDATKAVPPGQAGQAGQPIPAGELGRDRREQPTGDFLEHSHTMRKLVPTQNMDPRVIRARLITEVGERGTRYDLKVMMLDQYGREFGIVQKGRLVPRGNRNSVELRARNSMGMPVVTGKLASVIDMTTNDQCAYLQVELGQPMLGQTRLLVCEESDLDDDYDQDRNGRRRRY